MTTRQSEQTQIAVMGSQVSTIKDDVKEIKNFIAALGKNYVKREEFEPVRNVVFGLVALILVSVVGGFMALIINK